MSATASGIKTCVRCHKDLSGHRRLKDHNGQYWCADCGRADNAVRHSTPTSGHCHDCHGRYPASELHTDGEDTVCTGCLAGREKERRQLTAKAPAEDPSDRTSGRLLMVAAAVAATLIGAWGMGWM